MNDLTLLTVIEPYEGRLPYLSRFQLHRLGWSDEMIALFLPAPSPNTWRTMHEPNWSASHVREAWDRLPKLPNNCAQVPTRYEREPVI